MTTPLSGGMEILSDTGGVDMGPYIKRLHTEVELHWWPLIPEVALPPIMKSGVVTLEFAILKNGDIQAMKITQSSGDAALDRAAYGAITTSRPLPVLPVEFKHDQLVLRCRFIYNLSKEARLALDEQIRINREGLAEIRKGNWSGAEKLFQQAVDLDPKQDTAWQNLGRAQMGLHKYDEAAAAFERSIAIKSSDTKLNSAAYQLALSNTHLDLAETWSKTAISEVETQLNQITLQSAKTNAPGLLRKCSMYWDTLGWIRFQKEDLTAAENYLRAGWELLDDSTIGIHLARVYETQGRKSEAIEAYAQALAIASDKRELTADEKDARQRLAALLGGEPLVDARVSESRQRLKERRSVEVSNTAGSDIYKEYWVTLEPGAKLTELEPLSGDGQSDSLTAALRSASMPQSFPDAGILKMPRVGILLCSRSSRTCRFTLLSAGDSAQSAASSPAPSNP